MWKKESGTCCCWSCCIFFLQHSIGRHCRGSLKRERGKAGGPGETRLQIAPDDDADGRLVGRWKKGRGIAFWVNNLAHSIRKKKRGRVRSTHIVPLSFTRSMNISFAHIPTPVAVNENRGEKEESKVEECAEGKKLSQKARKTFNPGKRQDYSKMLPIFCLRSSALQQRKTLFHGYNNY